MHEGVELTKYGIGLLLFGIVLTVVLGVVRIGSSIGDSAVSGMSEAADAVNTAGVWAVVNNETKLSAASAYAFIVYNQEVISEVVCYVCDASGAVSKACDNPCILDHLQGEVRILATKNKENGLFDVTIRPGDTP